MSYSALFLDRDGVINERLPGRYVSVWEEFRWCPGNPQAIAELNALFDFTFVVTNQQGVGKGLMTEAQLQSVHERMLSQIQAAGGSIDRIYTCTQLKSEPGNCRKPSTAMGQQAQQDFPDIHFGRSVMVGDSLSDLEFGQRLGMELAWVAGKADDQEAIEQAIAAGLQVDYQIEKLSELPGLLRKQQTT